MKPFHEDLTAMRRAIAAIVMSGVMLAGVALAQQKAPAAAGGSYKELMKKRADFHTTMQKLQQEFEAPETTNKRKGEIQRTGQATVVDFVNKILIPSLGKAAVDEYAKNGEDADAEEVVLEYTRELIGRNQFREVYDITTSLIKAGRQHPGLYAFNGYARFALHDFAGAKQVLATAKKLDENLPDEAEQYLQQCDQYAQWFKEEQEIRAKEAKVDDLPQILLKTSRGDIKLELFENEAPNTVANFVSLVEKKFYDGTKFHRVLGNFMAQGGDPNSKDNDPTNDGGGGPGYRIPCECYVKNARKHFRGSLSMAHAGKDTGGSQFFITHRPTPHLNSGFINPQTMKPVNAHTVFGRVLDKASMDVAMNIQPGDVITSATVVRKRNHVYKPKTLPDTPPME